MAQLGAGPSYNSSPAASYQQGLSTYQQPKPSQGPLDYINSLAQPSYLAGQAQIGNQLAQIGSQNRLNDQNYSTQTGYINQNADYQRQLQALGGTDLANQLKQIQQGNTNLNQDYSNFYRDYYRQGPLQDQLHALQNQGYDQSGEQINYGADQSLRGLLSNATSRGAVGSEGYRQGITDINTGRGFSLADLARTRQGSDLNYGEQKEQYKNAGTDYQQQYDRAIQGIGNQLDNYNSNQQRFDIGNKQFESQVTQALQQLGLQHTMTAEQLQQAANDANMGRYNPLQQYLGVITQAAQTPTNMISQIFPKAAA